MRASRPPATTHACECKACAQCGRRDPIDGTTATPGERGRQLRGVIDTLAHDGSGTWPDRPRSARLAPVHYIAIHSPEGSRACRTRLALSLAVLFAIGSPAPAADPKADAELVKTAQGMLKDLRTHTLDNGLRVYLLPVKGSPIVTVMVAYKVGSGDEEKDQTGLSHYLEHLMFKGTDKLMPGDIDRATQRNGGRNNAYTTEDMTVYHFDFAADRWQIALDIEADRMRNIRIDAKHEFEQEKGAVIAELDGNEDQPWRPGVQDDPAAALPEGLAVLAPGHRRARARPRRDRRDHQAALRQVVSPEQRVARRSSAASTPDDGARRRSRSCSARSRRATCRRASPRPRSRTATARSARSSSRSSTCRGC